MKIKFIVALVLILTLCACNPFYNNREEASKHTSVCQSDEIAYVGCRDIFSKYNCYVACYPNNEKINECVDMASKIKGKENTVEDILIYCNKPVIRWG